MRTPCRHYLISWIAPFLFVAFLSATLPSSAQETKLAIAIIHGEGPREVNPILRVNLETALSKHDEWVLVEREQIQKALQELALSANGFLDTNQSLRLGNILGAQILIFVEKMIATQHESVTRFRLVDSKTGIELDTLFETEDNTQNMDSIVHSINKARQKLGVPLDQRQYIGILDLRNTEPGVALNGTAEALEMFLANDLASSPNIFVLDREHLQHLQNEQALSAMDINLKASTHVIEGGIQHASDPKLLKVQLFIYHMDGASPQTLDMQVPIDDIKETRRVLLDAILKVLTGNPNPNVPRMDQLEASMFLKNVDPMLLAAQYEDAVRTAEVAYTLEPNQDSAYWASRAWYFLGKNLLKDVDLYGRRTRLISRTALFDISDQFASYDLTQETSMAVRKRETRDTMIRKEPEHSRQDSQQTTEFWGESDGGSGVGDQGSKPSAASPTSDSRLPDRHIQSLVDDSTSNTTLRGLKAILRSVDLTQVYTQRYIQEFSTGQIHQLPIPDPTFIALEVEGMYSTNEDTKEDSLWFLPLPPKDKDQSDLYDIQTQLVNQELAVLATQRAFYLRLYSKDHRAAAAYWETWLRERHVVFNSTMYDPQFLVPFYQKVIQAFRTSPSEFNAERVKGLWTAMKFSSSESLIRPNKSKKANNDNLFKNYFQSLSNDPDLFLRLMANRMLMRMDPDISAENILKDFVIYQRDLAKTDAATEELDQFFADFLTVAVNHVAVYQKHIVLSYLPDIIEHVLKDGNPKRLLRWRWTLWPYINALGLKDKAAAVEVIHRCQNIVNAVPVMDASEAMNRLRAELDLKLVWLGAKKKADPAFNKFFNFPGLPSYLRQRAEIEAPRLEGPLDTTEFGSSEITYGQNFQSVKSKSNEFYSPDGGGVSSVHSFNRSVDAEGNEHFTTYSIEAQTASSSFLRNYHAEKTPVTVSPEDTSTRQPTQLINRSLLFDDDFIYRVILTEDTRAVSLTAYKYALTPPWKATKLGMIRVPIANATAMRINYLTVGHDKLYAGTSLGVFAYPLSNNLPMPSTKESSISQSYEPYYISTEVPTNAFKTNDNKPLAQDHNSDDVEYLNTANGLPDNGILSLAFLDGILYTGVGPAEELTPSLHGVSGLLAYDPQKKNFEILASSKTLHGKHLLEQGRPYQIKAMLGDHKRQCLWLAIGGNKELNGVWTYDLKTRQFKHVIKEDLSVLDLQWAGDQIVYAMYQSGWVLFDPKTMHKTWLMAYTVSAWTGANAALPPLGVTGQPLYGYPKTRLWPFTVTDNADLITIGWDTYAILLHQKNQPEVSMTNFDPRANYVSEISHVARNRYGLWVVMRYGQVFQLKPSHNAPPPTP